MGIAKLYGQSGSGGFKPNGIIQDYYAYAGENISAGDFVEFINGVAGQKTETSVDTEISATAGSGYADISAVKLDGNRVFIAHISESTNYYLMGIVCTISGTKIILGTDTQLSSTQQTGTETSLVLLDDGRVFIAHKYTQYSNLYATICSVSETIITVDVTTVLNSTNYTGWRISATKLDGDKVFVAHANTDMYLYGIVCTISGNTITKGTDTTIVSSENSASTTSAVTLSSSAVFIAHSSKTETLYGIVCTISGNTITKGTDTSLDPSSRTGALISTLKLDSNRVFIAHSLDTNLYLYGFIATINGTSITKGTSIGISRASYAGYRISTAKLNDNKVFVAHASSSNYYLYGAVCNIDGTTITVGIDTQLSTIAYTGYTDMPVLLLDNGTIFIAHSYSSNNYLYAQIFGIDKANNVPTNNVVIKEYETQVRKATTSDIYGVAKTSGEGGDETGHKDIIRVYQPYSEKQFVMADGNILTTSNGDVFLLKEAI